ncbi:hypothetical protein EYC80_002667 [Monilinia laxa]|uniref:Uncharacterized protein n=1 Tax=Monilinia laxa TaxID=61186 RepID=A0A5N6K4M9_MONLA|nr:hypothetical protein EYC80_002667 [Monilinia laxa]
MPQERSRSRKYVEELSARLGRGLAICFRDYLIIESSLGYILSPRTFEKDVTSGDDARSWNGFWFLASGFWFLLF